MKKLGLVVAVEIDAVLQDLGTCEKKERFCGFPVYWYTIANCQLVVIHTGAGEIAAAATTQLLIAHFGVELVVNFGVVGGLTPEMAQCQCCVVEKVVHYDFDTSEVDHCPVGQYVTDYPTVYIPCSPELLEKALTLNPKLQKVTCASGDKFIGDPEKKAELHRKFGAQICEMEAAGIVLTCNRSRIPCLLVKAVADSMTGGAEEYHTGMEKAARICLSLAVQVMEQL